MERLTIEKCGELLIKYDDGEHRSPCFGCESISKCNPQKMVCGFYKALVRLKEYEDIGLTPGQLIEIDKLYAEKCKELAQFQKNNLSGLELALVWVKLDKLKEYKKLEEQGKLTKLSCAVGDTVYEVQELRKRIQLYTVIAVHISKCGNLYGWELKDGKGVYSNVNGFSEYAIGKTVFLTQEEAEAVLKEITK